jgi:hypothetical protein
MPPMFLTLDVLKLLSGWLNTVASCAESKGEGMRCERGAGQEAGGGVCGAAAAAL